MSKQQNTTSNYVQPLDDLLKFKLVFLGPTFVGKTTLISQLVYTDVQSEEYHSTIGIDFFTKVIKINTKNLNTKNLNYKKIENLDIKNSDNSNSLNINSNSLNTNSTSLNSDNLENLNEKVKLQVWDTAGQERFNSLTINYLRDCFIAIIVFNLFDLKTVNEIEKYLKMVKNENGNKNFYFLIVGNKKDLVEFSFVEEINKINIHHSNSNSSSTTINDNTEYSSNIDNNSSKDINDNNSNKDINDNNSNKDENYTSALKTLTKLFINHSQQLLFYIETSSLSKDGITHLEDNIKELIERDYGRRKSELDLKEEVESAFMEKEMKKSWWCF